VISTRFSWLQQQQQQQQQPDLDLAVLIGSGFHDE
jgi:hypothetical protein